MSPCLGLWSLLGTQVKKVLPFFDVKYSKLSEMDFEGLYQIFPCFWCWVLNHNSWLSLWQREVRSLGSSASCTLVSGSLTLVRLCRIDEVLHQETFGLVFEGHCSLAGWLD